MPTKNLLLLTLFVCACGKTTVQQSGGAEATRIVTTLPSDSNASVTGSCDLAMQPSEVQLNVPKISENFALNNTSPENYLSPAIEVGMSVRGTKDFSLMNHDWGLQDVAGDLFLVNGTLISKTLPNSKPHVNFSPSDKQVQEGTKRGTYHLLEVNASTDHGKSWNTVDLRNEKKDLALYESSTYSGTGCDSSNGIDGEQNAYDGPFIDDSGIFFIRSRVKWHVVDGLKTVGTYSNSKHVQESSIPNGTREESYLTACPWSVIDRTRVEEFSGDVVRVHVAGDGAVDETNVDVGSFSASRDYGKRTSSTGSWSWLGNKDLSGWDKKIQSFYGAWQVNDVMIYAFATRLPSDDTGYGQLPRFTEKPNGALQYYLSAHYGKDALVPVGAAGACQPPSSQFNEYFAVGGRIFKVTQGSLYEWKGAKAGESGSGCFDETVISKELFSRSVSSQMSRTAADDKGNVYINYSGGKALIPASVFAGKADAKAADPKSLGNDDFSKLIAAQKSAVPVEVKATDSDLLWVSTSGQMMSLSDYIAHVSDGSASGKAIKVVQSKEISGYFSSTGLFKRLSVYSKCPAIYSVNLESNLPKSILGVEFGH